MQTVSATVTGKLEIDLPGATISFVASPSAMVEVESDQPTKIDSKLIGRGRVVRWVASGTQKTGRISVSNTGAAVSHGGGVANSGVIVNSGKSVSTGGNVIIKLPSTVGAVEVKAAKHFVAASGLAVAVADKR